jgi:CheY-like chemotaxis protein
MLTGSVRETENKRDVDPKADATGSKAPREILMIEDSATDAALAVRAFKRAKIINLLKVVSSGEEGFDYLLGAGAYAGNGAKRPEVILLDLGLPGMSGLEFLRRIKKEARTRAIPVVILSLSGTVPAIMEATRLGAAHYIVKPIDFENFVRITTLLRLQVTVRSPWDAAESGP